MAESLNDLIKKAVTDTVDGLRSVTAGHDPMERTLPEFFADDALKFDAPLVQRDDEQETDAAGFAVAKADAPEPSAAKFETPVVSLAPLKKVDNPLVKKAKLDKTAEKISGVVGGAVTDAVKERRTEREKVVKAYEKTLNLRKEQINKIAEDQAKDALKKRSGKFVVAGRITDKESGAPLVGVRVKAYDLDRKQDDPLGETFTDSNGYYRVEYSTKDIQEADKKPETYIEVMDEHDEVVYKSTRTFITKSGDVEEINVVLNKGSFETSKAIGARFTEARNERVRAADKRLVTLDNSKPVLLNRLNLTRK